MSHRERPRPTRRLASGGVPSCAAGIGTGTRTGRYARRSPHLRVRGTNPAHGVRKPAYQKRTRRLSEDEYRLLGKLLRKAAQDDQLATAAVIARTIALTACRRCEIINLIWPEEDIDSSCPRLTDSKEGASVRPSPGSSIR